MLARCTPSDVSNVVRSTSPAIGCAATELAPLAAPAPVADELGAHAPIAAAPATNRVNAGRFDLVINFETRTASPFSEALNE